MAFFELKSNSCDGHIRALSKAIMLASKISREALLEFTTDKVRLCARTDILLMKFVFNKEFFTDYRCDQRIKCFVNLKALTMPFRSLILVNGESRDGALRSTIKLTCQVEDVFADQMVFKIFGEPATTTLTYRLTINDLDPDRMRALNSINRTIDIKRVEIAPKHNSKERFLLSAFNNFAPDIDQVTIQCSQSEIRFIGSTSPLPNCGLMLATSEFTHKKCDFEWYDVREDINITVPLKYLKLFLNFVETNRIQTLPKYVFEGVGLPAHFIYDATLFKAHFVSSTSHEYIPDGLDIERPLPIAFGNANESFIAEENVYQADDADFDEYNQNGAVDYCDDNDDEEEEYDGYNDNESHTSELMDGNLDGFLANQNNADLSATSGYGNESIRGEMLTHTYDPDKIKDILEPLEDPEDYENVEIQYSSDEE